MKKQEYGGSYVSDMRPDYPPVEGFLKQLDVVASLIKEHDIPAYTEIMDDEYPDPEGKTFPLVDLVNAISTKAANDDLEGAVDDIYHFEDSPFSLVSYIMKAHMAGRIKAQTLTDIAALIPLPPIVVENFSPPDIPVIGPPHVPPCLCEPLIKIKITLTYRPACGNYTKEFVGYAANNTLNGMKKGTMYKFDAEVEGCGCGGSISNNVVTGASNYGFTSGSGGKSATLISESSGNFTITFVYICGCGCGSSASESFDINF